MKIALMYERNDEINSFPLSVSFLAYSLKKSRHEVMAFNLKDPEHMKRIGFFRPDYIGIGIYAEGAADGQKIIQAVRNAYGRNVPYIIGGPEVTKRPLESLRTTNADFAVRGEGIGAIEEIIAGNYDAQGILTRNSASGTINGVRPPRINEWAIDIDMVPVNPRGSYNVVQSMGCYGRCDFCSVRDFFPKIMYRPLDKVIEDMLVLDKEKGAKYFFFVDDNFLNDKGKRLVELVNMMERESLYQTMRFLARADSIIRAEKALRQVTDTRAYAGKDVTNKLARLARKIITHDQVVNTFGLIRGVVEMIDIGAESFLPEQLERYRKGITPQQNHDAIEIARRNGIFPNLYMLVGDEETDFEEIQKVSQFFIDNPFYLTLVGDINLKQTFPHMMFKDYPEWIRRYVQMLKILTREDPDSHWSGPEIKFKFMMGIPPTSAERELAKEQFEFIHQEIRKLI